MKQKMLISKSWISYLWDCFSSFIQYTSIMLSASVDSSVDEGERHPIFHQARLVSAYCRASSFHGVAGALILFS